MGYSSPAGRIGQIECGAVLRPAAQRHEGPADALRGVPDDDGVNDGLFVQESPERRGQEGEVIARKVGKMRGDFGFMMSSIHF